MFYADATSYFNTHIGITLASGPVALLLLVLPELMDIRTIKLPDFAIIAGLSFAPLTAGTGAIIVFASQINRLARSPRSMMILKRSLAGVLTLGGGWLAFA